MPHASPPDRFVPPVSSLIAQPGRSYRQSNLIDCRAAEVNRNNGPGPPSASSLWAGRASCPLGARCHWQPTDSHCDSGRKHQEFRSATRRHRLAKAVDEEACLHTDFDASAVALRSLSSRSNAFLYSSWSFQLLKSGTKYSRISRAESLPLSASKHFHS